MKPKKICALITYQVNAGDIQINDYSPQSLKQKQILKNYLITLLNLGYGHFITGLELGADTWCAEMLTILKRQIPTIYLECILPFEHQADSWNIYQRENYFSLISQADHVRYSSRSYSTTCRAIRDQRMIQNANLALLLHSDPSAYHSKVNGYAHCNKTQMIHIDRNGNTSPQLSLAYPIIFR